jgi:uncharacterized membrane protein
VVPGGDSDERTDPVSANALSVERGDDRAGLLIAGGYAAVVFLLGWFRHRSYWSGFDLAIFDQAAWQLSEGRDHISIVERHVLSDHFSPVIYLFGLAYRAVASPLVLLLAQAVALGATVLPLRALARDLGAHPSLASLLVVGSAPLLSAGMFDFHPSTLSVPFVAAAVLYGRRDRPLGAGLAALGVAVCRADLGIAVIAAGIVARGRARWVLWSAGLASLLVGTVAPDLIGETGGWDTYFGHLGNSPLDAALQPWVTVGELLHPQSISTIFLWFVAAGLAGLLAPRWALAVALVGVPVVLSQWEGTTLPWYHYGAPVAPIAIGATLVAVTGPPPASLRGSSWVRLPIAAASIGLLAASPLSPAAPDSVRAWSVVRPQAGFDFDGARAAVAAGETVSASHRLLPHLSQRQHLYLFPLPFGPGPVEFFPPGTGPDPNQYDPASVDVIAVQQFLVPEDGVEGYLVVEEPEGMAVLRRE